VTHQEPRTEKANPPSCEKSDGSHEYTIRQANVGIMKLIELEFRKVLRGNGVCDLVVDYSVNARDNNRDGNHGRQVAQGDSWNQESEHRTFSNTVIDTRGIT